MALEAIVTSANAQATINRTVRHERPSVHSRRLWSPPACLPNVLPSRLPVRSSVRPSVCPSVRSYSKRLRSSCLCVQCPSVTNCPYVRTSVRQYSERPAPLALSKSVCHDCPFGRSSVQQETRLHLPVHCPPVTKRPPVPFNGKCPADCLPYIHRLIRLPVCASISNNNRSVRQGVCVPQSIEPIGWSEIACGPSCQLIKLLPCVARYAVIF